MPTILSRLGSLWPFAKASANHLEEPPTTTWVVGDESIRVSGSSPAMKVLIFLRSLFTKGWPYLLVLEFVFALILVTNFPFGSWYSGWDNLHPEFNVKANLLRAFSVWQGNEGVGLIGGHGYAATLLHTLFLGAMSVVLPLSHLRSFFTFLMLFVGATGCFVFLRTLHSDKSPTLRNTAALFGSLFYLLNYATIQHFYIQLEAFIIHYGVLPWLFTTFFLVLKKPSKGHIALFALTSIASTPQGFIPPLFVMYVLSIGMYLLVYIAQKRSFERVKTAAIITLITICANAFWLLPVAYYTAANSQTYLNSYQNKETTETFVLRNRKFGTLPDVAILRGFYSEAIDSYEPEKVFYILQPWTDHLSTIPVKVIGYSLFAIIVFGIWYALKNYKDHRIAFVLLFLLAFTALATDTPPFSVLSSLMRQLPVFNQAFRAAFTKVAIILALWYSVFLSIGLIGIIQLIWSRTRTYKTALKLSISTCIVLFACLIGFSFPVFTGNLLYKRTKLHVPDVYTQLFTFFKGQDKSSRIANFPQEWNWGWSMYTWGYSGSGFLWYGIEQPILDRAFDVWSPYNENYYWEASYAIYTNDSAAFDRVLEKYAVSWILYDKNFTPFSTVNGEESRKKFEQLLAGSKKIKQYKQFKSNDKDISDIVLYKVNLESKPKQSVSLLRHAINVKVGQTYNYIDNAFKTKGYYVTDTAQDFDTFYPFSSLFTGRGGVPDGVSITTEKESIVMTTSIPAHKEPYVLDLPSLYAKLQYMPVHVRSTVSGASTSIDLVYDGPSIRIDGKTVSSGKMVRHLGQTLSSSAPLSIYAAGTYVDELTVTNNDSVDFVIAINAASRIDVQDRLGRIVASYDDPLLTDLTIADEYTVAASTVDQKLEVTYPLLAAPYRFEASDDQYFYGQEAPKCRDIDTGEYKTEQGSGSDGQFIRFTSRAVATCFEIQMPSALQSQDYLVGIKSRNKSGRGLLYAMINNTTGRADSQTYLPQHDDVETSYFIQPAMDASGTGYTLHLENISYGRETATNDLFDIWVQPIPLSFFTSIQFEKESKRREKASYSTSFTANKINDSLYTITFDKTANTQVAVLHQGFDPGWKAYDSRCGLWVVGCELQNHMMVNGWANGWQLPSNSNRSTIVMFYLPQVLQYAGYALLLCLGVFTLVSIKRPKNKQTIAH